MQINLDVPEEIARNFGEDARSVERAVLEGLRWRVSVRVDSQGDSAAVVGL